MAVSEKSFAGLSLQNLHSLRGISGALAFTAVDDDSHPYQLRRPALDLRSVCHCSGVASHFPVALSALSEALAAVHLLSFLSVRNCRAELCTRTFILVFRRHRVEEKSILARACAWVAGEHVPSRRGHLWRTRCRLCHRAVSEPREQISQPPAQTLGLCAAPAALLWLRDLDSMAAARSYPFLGSRAIPNLLSASGLFAGVADVPTVGRIDTILGRNGILAPCAPQTLFPFASSAFCGLFRCSVGRLVARRPRDPTFNLPALDYLAGARYSQPRNRNGRPRRIRCHDCNADSLVGLRALL